MRGERKAGRLSLLAMLWAGLAPAAAPAPQGPTAADLSLQLDQIAARLQASDENLRFVETQFTERPEPTDEEAHLRRLSAAEIQYLLGDYKSAAVLFYDLVADQRFHTHPRYPDALYFLSDALYQQKNFLGAKLYLRELLSLRSSHYQEALARYLELAGKLDELKGIETYYQQAQDANGSVPPEVAYVYGKWTFKRSDLPLKQRLQRAIEIFTPLAEAPEGPTRSFSAYFIGVCQVKLGQLADAVSQFEKVAALEVKDPREQVVRDLAQLSLGRLLGETGQYEAALERYQAIPQESEHHVEALYEAAWLLVRKGDYEKAKNTLDVLLMLAPDTTLTPEAKILQGHLQLRLKSYDEATATYEQVINTYAPVHDEIDALLKLYKNPVRYFDDLLKRNEKNLDVSALLPPVALKWATTQREVSDAVRVIDDLEAGRHGMAEANEISRRVLAALDERGLEVFPALQDGYTRADAVDSGLTAIYESLVRFELLVLDPTLTAAEKERLSDLLKEQAPVEKRFRTLPKTLKDVEQRRNRMQEKVAELDGAAFKLGYELQSLFATAAALEKWVYDTREQRAEGSEETEKPFVERLSHELSVLKSQQKELDALRQRLQDEKVSVDTVLGGEELVRNQYEAGLAQQHELAQAALPRLPSDRQRMFERANEIRERTASLKQRVTAAKASLRDQVARRGQKIRDAVASEQQKLASYSQEIASVSANARDLVGRIVVSSFEKVRRQFYELVLKADVGVVDVAFTRKQDNTAKIQKLSAEKDRELRALDEEFREVLEDVE